VGNTIFTGERWTFNEIMAEFKNRLKILRKYFESEVRDVDLRLLQLVGGIIVISVAVAFIPFMLHILLVFLMGVALLIASGNTEGPNRATVVLKRAILVPVIALAFTFNGYRQGVEISEQSAAIDKVIKRIDTLLPRGKFDQAEERLLKVANFDSASNFAKAKSILDELHRLNSSEELRRDILEMSQVEFDNLLLERVDRRYLRNRYIDREYIKRMVKLAPAMKKDFARAVKKTERSLRKKNMARFWQYKKARRGEHSSKVYREIVQEIGAKPQGTKPYGEIEIVSQWLKNNISDAGRIRAREWFKVKLIQSGGKYFWWTILKYQTTHRGGRFSTYKRQFFMRNGQVIKSKIYSH
jgi:hypothetical protein